MHRQTQLRSTSSRRNRSLSKANVESVVRQTSQLFVAELLERRMLLSNNTFTVSNLNDTGSGSLRQAILNANASTATTDTINFTSGLSGTINVQDGELPVFTSDITLNGPGASLITVNGGGDSAEFGPVFIVGDGDFPGISAEIENLTITGGHFGSETLLGSGGINVNSSSTLTVANCTITGNTSFDGGGISDYGGSLTVVNSVISRNDVIQGVAFGNVKSFGRGGGIFSTGTLTLIGSAITGNTAGNSGGGVYTDGGLFTATGSSVLENVSQYGGGICSAPGYSGQEFPTTPSPITLTNSIVIGNIANVGGGILSTGVLNLNGSTINGNSASQYGGGISTDAEHRVGNPIFTLSDTSVNGNSATAYGGGIFSGGMLTLTNSTMVSGNTAGVDGGGIQNYGTLTVTNSTVSSNMALLGRAGGIGSEVQLTITNSTISANSAVLGGGISNSGQATVTGSTLSGNIGKDGGGIYNSGTMTVSGSTLGTNSASTLGGGIDNLNSLTVSSSTISGNSSGNAGGGLYNTGAVTVSGSTIGTNSAAIIGGGIGDVGLLTLTSSTLSGNSAARGGAVYEFPAGAVTLTSSTVSGNSAVRGGGVYNFGTLTVNSTTISGNSGLYGGGILNRGNKGGGTLAITNSTVSGNTAGEGGGVYSVFGVLTVTDSTISGNGASKGGGLYVGTASTVNGTLIAANPGGDILNVASAKLTGSHDLIGDGSDGGVLTSSLRGTVAKPLNPLLSALGNFGGPTQTMALISDSPAIGAGAVFQVQDSSGNVITAADQRGVPRGLPIDIGAFQSGPLIVNTGTDPATFSPGILSLREAISIADAAETYAAQTILFDSRLVTINPTSPLLDIGSNITIDGLGASLLSVNDGGHGSVFTVTGSNVLIENLTVTGGNSSFGGGIAIYSGGLTLANSTISGNDASTAGGGIDMMFGFLTINNCTISSNSALSIGGGIVNDSGMLSITNCTIASNSVFGGNGGNGNGGGGGVCSYANSNGEGATTITNSTITGNISNGDGGGISINLSSLTVVNSTITGNFGQNGSAVYGNGSLTFVDDTISANIPSGFGAFVFGMGGNGQQTHCTLDGTILAGNFGQDLNVGFNGILSGSNDVIGNGNDGGVLTNTLRGVTNPMLSSLGNFGGPTQTMALLPGSPAIGAGTAFGVPGVNIFTDQRGIARPQGSEFDIGAYEIQRSAFVVNTVSDAATQPIGSVTLRDAIASAISIGGSNTITFAGGLSGTINLIDPLPALGNNTTIDGPGPSVITINGQGQGQGPIFIVNAGITSEIENLTITGGVYSGGIENFGTLTVASATITGNYGFDAGGLGNEGSLYVIDSIVTGNSCYYEGGGLSSTGYMLIDNSTVSGNFAEYGGGVFNGGTLVVTGSTISGNTAGNNGVGSGGGIYSSGTLHLTNSTVSGNISRYGGGGIENFKGALTVTDSTISGNSAVGGAAIDDTAGSITLNGTILAADVGGEINIKSSGSLAGSNDLVGDGSDGGVLTKSLRGTLAKPLNPLLAPLGNFGGPTQTMALLADSPAIAAGANFTVLNASNMDVTATDQRGVARPSSVGIDIGAYQGSLLVGDTNFDGSVNLTDLLTLLNSYGQSGKDWAHGDFNADGTVNLTDLLALLNNYGESGGIATDASAAAIIYKTQNTPFANQPLNWNAAGTLVGQAGQNDADSDILERDASVL